MGDATLKIMGLKISDPVVVSALGLGALVMFIGFIIGRRSRSNKIKNETKCLSDDKVQELKNAERAVASSKRTKNKKRREVQQEFTHSWIVGALKGHTGSVLEIDFSGDDKFLASCAEDCSRFRRQRRRGSIEIGVAEYRNNMARVNIVATIESNTTDDSPSSPDSPNISDSLEIVETLTSTGENLSNVLGSSSPAMIDAELIRVTRRSRKNRQSPREPSHCRDSNDSNEDPVRTRRIWRRSHERPNSKRVLQHKQRRNVQPTSMTRARKNQGSNLANQSVHKPEKKKTPADPPQPSSDIVTKVDNQLIIVDASLNTSISVPHNSKPFEVYTSVTNDYFQKELLRYIINPCYLVHLGYPVLGGGSGKHAFFFREPHAPHSPRLQRVHHQLDANAQEFVPKRRRAPENNNEASITAVVSPTLPQEEVAAALPASQQRSDRDNDSGRGSAENSDLDPDSSSDSEKTSDTNDSNSWLPSSSSSASPSPPPPSLVSTSIKERECARCYKPFLTDNNGDYITKDPCLHHWGKKRRNEIDQYRYYTCCHHSEFSPGCTVAPRHVWSGVHIGCNGPFEGFVVTQPAEDPLFNSYALDCEMCYTKLGLELTKVTVVGLNGEIVYDTYVKPHNEIIDYNTRFSGITAEHLKDCTTTLQDVQAQLLMLITNDTILMGHALENDLRALKIIHPTIIDTCHVIKNNGFILRASLKMLAQIKLGRQIQVSQHDSYEDAQTVIDLVKYQVWEDYRKRLKLLLKPNSVGSVV